MQLVREEVDSILRQIESFRKELESIINAKGIEDPDVMAGSRMMDAMLNEYYKLLKKKKV